MHNEFTLWRLEYERTLLNDEEKKLDRRIRRAYNAKRALRAIAIILGCTALTGGVIAGLIWLINRI